MACMPYEEGLLRCHLLLILIFTALYIMYIYQRR